MTMLRRYIGRPSRLKSRHFDLIKVWCCSLKPRLLSTESRRWEKPLACSSHTSHFTQCNPAVRLLLLLVCSLHLSSSKDFSRSIKRLYHCHRFALRVKVAEASGETDDVLEPPRLQDRANDMWLTIDVMTPHSSERARRITSTTGRTDP